MQAQSLVSTAIKLCEASKRLAQVYARMLSR